MGDAAGHQAVLAEEVATGLAPAAGQDFIDGTLGGGGHTQRLLQATAPSGRVLAVDLDGGAIRRMQDFLAGEPALSSRVILVHGNFKNLAEICRQHNFTPTGGCLLDLGVSSFQLDDREAGFGFESERLDFRFDAAAGIPTAADLLNRLAVRELEVIFREFGEEPLARPIAWAVDAERKQREFRQARQLGDLVARVYAHRYRSHSRRHPATKVFQALRIAVNGELDNLRGALQGALQVLPTGARIAIISFHSLEDRIVKQFFRTEARGCLCPPNAPQCVCEHQPTLKIVTPKPIRPGAAEVHRNPRSRSAKLRIAVRLPTPTIKKNKT